MSRRSSLYLDDRRGVHVWEDATDPGLYTVEWGDQRLCLPTTDWAFLCLLLGPRVGITP